MLDPRGRTLTRAPRRNVLTLVLLLLAAPAPADYKDSFKKGIDAYDRKRWDEVVKHMREAIGENPAEGERIKLYGLRFEMYFPHFYLGAAYLNLGKCPEAVGEFKLSESQGAIRSSPRYAQLVDGLKSCEAMTPTTTTTTMPPAPIRPPTPVPTTLAPPPPPTTMASTAPPTTPIPNPPPTPTPTPASIAPPPAPPAVLREGAQAYFDRRYQEAVTLLSRATGLRARAAAQSLLLRSAARFALFRAGGEKDPDLRRLAAEDAAASRRADPTLRPDPEAFSPQFVDFFGASR